MQEFPVCAVVHGSYLSPTIARVRISRLPIVENNGNMLKANSDRTNRSSGYCICEHQLARVLCGEYLSKGKQFSIRDDSGLLRIINRPSGIDDEVLIQSENTFAFKVQEIYIFSASREVILARQSTLARMTRSTQILILPDSIRLYTSSRLASNDVEGINTFLRSLALQKNFNSIGEKLTFMMTKVFLDHCRQALQSLFVHASSGSGFTQLIHHIASRLDTKTTLLIDEIWAIDLLSKKCVEPEVLYTKLQRSLTNEPCIIILQDFDVFVWNKAENAVDELSHKLLHVIRDFLKLLTSARKSKQIFLIARTRDAVKVTNKVSQIFEETMHLSDLLASERAVLIKMAASFINPTNYEPEESQVLNLIPYTSGLGICDVLSITFQYLRLADTMNKKKSSPLLKGSFDGHIQVINLLKEIILWPRKFTSIFQHFFSCIEYENHKHSIGATGILLYGPSGSGKTAILKQIGCLFSCQVQNVQISQLVRGEIGSGEENLREIFQRSKILAPCIVVIDEFESIFTSKKGNDTGDVGASLSSTLAGCFDEVSIWNKFAGFENQIVVVGASNKPWMIDKSFLRAGRFDKYVFVGPLSESERSDMMRHYCPWLSVEQMRWLLHSTLKWLVADVEFLLRGLKKEMLLTKGETSLGTIQQFFMEFDMNAPEEWRW